MSISRYRLLLRFWSLSRFCCQGNEGISVASPHPSRRASWLAALRFVGSRWA